MPALPDDKAAAMTAVGAGSAPRFPHLFLPLSVGPVTFKNQIC